MRKRKWTKLDHIGFAISFIIIGIITCAQTEAEGNYETRISDNIANAPYKVVIGVCLVAFGLWCFYPFIKNNIERD